ncbi:MAG: GAF domain-containing protein [Acidobacteria bacterium]|nr:MAG: GAF domain-containing protein [Acidobacteriota bacterium]REK10192.1 MAG: GAF domain-containing protein [Acidobacteriota bacterium]
MEEAEAVGRIGGLGRREEGLDRAAGDGSPPALRRVGDENSRDVRELTLLYRLSRLLEQSLDLRDVVPPMLEALSEEWGLHRGTLTLLNRKSGDIHIHLAHGTSPREAQRGRYRLGEGVTGTVVQTGQPAVIEKASQSQQFLDRTRKRRRGEFSFLCVPIKSGQEIFGALSVERDWVDGHDLGRDARMLSIVGSMIAQAVKMRRAAEEERERLEEENERLRAELKDRYRPSNIVGQSHEMQEVYDQIATVSTSNTSVLILGETGTGKELVAQAIHYDSDRSSRPFVKVHCAALPESVIESELFGHVKGAFTGAVSDRKGRFELAHGGTLFLDEVGEIPLSIQIKLLRVLQEREFERVGGTSTVKVDVRLIAATNKDLAVEVAQNRFREDLYYRLNVFPIHVPALRKRKSDIVLLADFFLEKFARSSRKSVRRLSSATIDLLMSYHWPGNVRELESCLERAVLVAEGDVIHPYHLPPTLQAAEVSGDLAVDSLKYRVEAFERDLLRDALKSTRGNMASAARLLQTTQRIIGYKVKKYRIDPARYAT